MFKLSIIEYKIHEQLPLEFAKSPRLTQKFMTSVLEEVGQQERFIVEDIFPNTMHFKDEKQIELTIRREQYRLISLLDMLAVYLSDEDLLRLKVTMSTDNSTIQFFRSVYNWLENRLRFLELNFSRYLDVDYKISPLDVHQLSLSVLSDFKVINAFFEKTDLDPELSKIINDTIGDLVNIDYKNAHISLRRANYLRKLAEQLLIFSKTHTDQEGDLTYKLHACLLSINFNNPAYFDFIVRLFSKEIDALETLNDKHIWLIYQQRNINQQALTHEIFYQEKYPPLKQLLRDWINAELHSYEVLKQLEDTKPAIGELNKWKDFKIETTLTVAELGCLFGLMMDQGMIAGNKQEFASFISFFFTSKKGTIAMHSLRNNFYNNNATVFTSVRDHLRTLVNMSWRK
jgi:hypothetical protein